MKLDWSYLKLKLNFPVLKYFSNISPYTGSYLKSDEQLERKNYFIEIAVKTYIYTDKTGIYFLSKITTMTCLNKLEREKITYWTRIEYVILQTQT